MAYSVYRDRRIIDCEEHAVVPDSKTKLRCEVGKALHISLEIVRHFLDSVEHSLLLVPRQAPKILQRSGLESDLVDHRSKVPD